MKNVIPVVFLIASCSAFGACGGGGWKKPPVAVAEAKPTTPAEPAEREEPKEKPKAAVHETEVATEVASESDEPRKPRSTAGHVVEVKDQGSWQSPLPWIGIAILALICIEMYLRWRNARLPDERGAQRADVQDPEQGHQA